MSLKVGFNTASFQTRTGQSKTCDGIGVYTRHIIQLLQQSAHQPVSCYFKNIPESFLYFMSNEYHYCNAYLSGLFPGSFYKKLENIIDVFHATDHYLPQLKNTPLIATLHDAIMFSSHSSRRKGQLLKQWLWRKHAQYIDQVITSTAAMIPELVQHWQIDENKISVIPIAIDKCWFQKKTMPEKSSVLKQYAIEKPFFLMVGTLQPRKNYLRAIEAFLALPESLRKNYQLVIVGKVGVCCEQEVALLKKLANTDAVLWLQAVAYEDLQTLYQAAHALLFPSLSEGFGLPIVEGFASEIPVITSNIPATAEVAGEAALLVDPYSVPAITEALLTMIGEPSVRSDFVAAGLMRAQEFTEEKMAAALLDVYSRSL